MGLMMGLVNVNWLPDPRDSGGRTRNSPAQYTVDY